MGCISYFLRINLEKVALVTQRQGENTTSCPFLSEIKWLFKIGYIFIKYKYQIPMMDLGLDSHDSVIVKAKIVGIDKYTNTIILLHNTWW